MADSIKFTSLNAVAATGVGNECRFGRARGLHNMQVKVTGAPTGCVVALEGSLDLGVTWGVLATWDITKSYGSGDFVSAAANLQERIRAHLTTLSGGTSPTVTAIIVSDDD